MSTDPVQIWRDYVTDGVPSSGKHEPVKGDIRTWAARRDTPGYRLRNATTAAALAAALSDGEIGFLAGLPLQKLASATGTASVTNDLSVNGLIIPTGAPIDARAFGIDADGSKTYDDEWSNLITYALANRTSPAHASSWGQNTVIMPKGRIRLTNGLTKSSILGLKFLGMGVDATTIEYENDTDAFLDFTTYQNIVFEDLTVAHTDQGAGFGSWTCDFLKLDGNGGGRGVYLNRVHTRGFRYLLNLSGASEVNEGDNWISHCNHLDCEAVIRSRSSQAINNKIESTRITGKTLAVYDLAGAGNSAIYNSNVLIDGALFSFVSESGAYGTSSHYNAQDVKIEYANNAGYGAGSRTQIVAMDQANPSISGQVYLNNVVLDGGFTSTIDAAYPAIQASARLPVYWRGGSGRNGVVDAEIMGSGVQTSDDNPLVLFEGLIYAPAPSDVSWNTDLYTSGYPSVQWKNCQNQINLTMTENRPMGGTEPRAINTISSGIAGYLYNGGGTSATDFTLDFDGVSQCFREIALVTGEKYGGTVTVKAFPTAAKNAPDQIGTTLTLSAANGDQAFEVMSGIDGYVGTEITIEVDVGTTGTAMRGYLQVISDAVPANT